MKVQIDKKLHTLIRDAMRITGHRTERRVVEAGLRVLIRINRQAAIRRLRDKELSEAKRALDEMVRENQRLGLYDNPLPRRGSKRRS